MKVEILYGGGRIDVFDTACFTAQAPLGPSNVIANFELRAEDPEASGVRLMLHGYSPPPAGEPAGEWQGVPEAAREKGWCMLLATPDEAQRILSVTCDGTVAMFRHRGGIVDAVTFDALCAGRLRSPASLSVDERVYLLGEALCLEDDALAANAATLARSMGVPEAVYRESVAAAVASAAAREEWEEQSE